METIDPTIIQFLSNDALLFVTRFWKAARRGVTSVVSWTTAQWVVPNDSTFSI